MYHIDNKTAALKEVQRLLGLNQTGAFDAATKRAVSEIQADHSLEQKDEVDYEAFTVILEKYYNRRNSIPNSDYLFSPAFPYVVNDINDNIELIHKALVPILKEYRYEGILPRGNFLGQSTLIAVNFLRDIFGLPKSDIIDAKFVNRLLLERNALEIKSKYGNK